MPSTGKISYKERSESASVFLLIIIFLSILRPVSPCLLDGFAHVFWNKQHHLMMHMEGMSHVDRQMEKLNTDGDDSQKRPGISINIENVFTSFTPEIVVDYYPPRYNLMAIDPYVFYTQFVKVPETIPPDVISCIALPEMLQQLIC